MHPDEVLNRLISKYPGLIWTEFDFPKAHTGQGEIKAIVLGADPTHIVDGKPVQIKVVFDLSNYDKSPYWMGINKNLQYIGLTLENVYVQNVCRNYFTCETSQNEKWVEVARNYMIPFLRQELDELFEKKIPILMTTQFILWAALEDQTRRMKPGTIYRKCISIPADDNLFKRNLYALYRHPYYSLKRPGWEKYKNFLTEQVENLHQ